MEAFVFVLIVCFKGQLREPVRNTYTGLEALRGVSSLRMAGPLCGSLALTVRIPSGHGLW